MKPILLDIAEEFETERLTLRIPRPGDGAMVQAAYAEAGDHIFRWVPFANPKITLEEAEEDARRRRARFYLRELFFFEMFLKGTQTWAGEIALHHVDWSVPKFEIGYLVHPAFEGQGYCGEALAWITRFGFDCLGAQRMEIWCDARNVRSMRAAERAGYPLEGILRSYRRDEWDGSLVDKHVYAKVRDDVKRE